MLSCTRFCPLVFLKSHEKRYLVKSTGILVEDERSRILVNLTKNLINLTRNILDRSFSIPVPIDSTKYFSPCGTHLCCVTLTRSANANAWHRLHVVVTFEWIGPFQVSLLETVQTSRSNRSNRPAHCCKPVSKFLLLLRAPSSPYHTRSSRSNTHTRTMARTCVWCVCVQHCASTASTASGRKSNARVSLRA